MKNHLTLLLLLSTLAMCENPKITYVELADSSTHAGTRKSRSNLLCVKRNGISVRAKAGQEGESNESPKWSVTSGSLSSSGLTATWSGSSNSSIICELEGSTSSANVSVLPDNKYTYTLLKTDHATVVDSIKEFNSLISKIGWKAGLIANGTINLAISDCDFYNNGEKIGKKIEASGSISASIGAVSGQLEVPTSLPSLKVLVSGSVDPQKLSIGATGSFDESKQSPWNLTGKLTWEASVSAKAGLAVGLPAGYTLVECTVQGITSIGVTGNIVGKDKKIVISGSMNGKALEVIGKVTWRLGFTQDLAMGTKTFGEPYTKSIPESVLYSIN